MAALQSVMVANRGEIAVRILRACRDLDIRSIAICNDRDQGSYHTRFADEIVRLEGTALASTYLNVPRLIQAAIAAGAHAIHPGYGFLSENAEFAEAVELAGLIFIGPSSGVIRQMGDKLLARAAATEAGLPVLAASIGPVTTVADAQEFIKSHGLPIAIKAVYGGGGRGMRIVDDASELSASLESAWREADAAFGRSECYLERRLVGPRHIEVQVFGDSDGHITTLGDRDCSLQRRYQKLLEECPAANVSAKVRAELSEAATRLARYVGYRSAGTCEFLLDPTDEAFYFLEMNTRLQVEHPVTEMVWGVDLVQAQLRQAGGETGLFDPTPTPRGHAIEIRINAEDPRQNFFPSPGRIEKLIVPAGPNIRLDLGMAQGSEITGGFDSLIGKLIAWGPDRESARATLRRALLETEVSGVETTLSFHRAIIEHPLFIGGNQTTATVEEELENLGLRPPSSPSDVRALAFQAANRRFVVTYPRQPTTEVPNGGPIPDRLWSGLDQQHAGAADQSGVVAPMSGTVVGLKVAVSDSVTVGQTVAVMEAMKMETHLASSLNGKIEAIYCSVGNSVEKGTLLMRVTPEAE